MRASVLILPLMLTPAWAAEPDPEAGAAMFQAACATCHGIDANGDGPMTDILTITPPDLTQLAARNGGVFAMGDVVRQIDGRDVILAHGGAMPIFGKALGENDGVIEDADGNPIFTTQAVVDIAAWLETVQD